MTAIERFSSKWTLDPVSGCWLWNAAVDKEGYGRFALDGHNPIGAHRAAWELFVGPIPIGMLVCHGCDTRHCVRVGPGHLFLGTHVDNMQDASRKGRVVVPLKSFSSDDTHQMAVLTNAEVRALRAVPASVTTSEVFRAGDYKVCYKTVWTARTGRTFRDVV